jgi:phosphoribosylformylglycinamidine synthase
MLALIGSSCLSPSKRDELLAALRSSCPKVVSVDAVHLHLVDCISAEAEAELLDPNSTPKKILDHLLDYGDDHKLDWTTTALAKLDKALFVVPRLGSISPWSSKATDIASLCNLRGHISRLERGRVYVFQLDETQTLAPEDIRSFVHLIHDRMTQIVVQKLPEQESIFAHSSPAPLRTIDLISASENGTTAHERMMVSNKELGLALASDEVDYLVDAFATGPTPINRDPTDAELFMFAQVNSEHCRHKIFNASWTIDGEAQDLSLFKMIRNTEAINGTGTISAYSDNAAVLEGNPAPRFSANSGSLYTSQMEDMPMLIKVETHNHPTAISPYPGASTGSGGEIRDEGAVGRGSRPKAGLAGFTVSNLLIPGFVQPWETDFGRPAHIASPLDIMIEGPLGASAFNDEFGRPALTGYFRTFCESVPVSEDGKQEIKGYHKPIMIAGGYGNVRPAFAKKSAIAPGAKLVVLGGPGLLIGLGGGAASSQVSGEGSADLDFASVQRDNPEMQRRCQQVIDACVSLGERNPIESIHDVGAGGLSNALPELVHDSGLGAIFEIRDVLVADSSMSPMEIWCNESQERYVLAISASQIDEFEQIANRERCPFSVVGVATEKEELIVTDRLLGKDVINLKMSTLFGKPPRMSRQDVTRKTTFKPFDSTLATYLPEESSLNDRLAEAVNRVLHLPSVGSKSFLITIGDRTISGLVTRDQMVGPWQVPVADVAVTRTSYGFDVNTGEAMAMGERTPLALLQSAASARMAIAESLTNLAASSISSLDRVKLSANWMCAASKPGEGAGLYEAVKAVGMELCPALGVGIPVGKDSMSMSMKWKQDGEQREVSSPLSLIVTAFAPVQDVRATWTPQIRTDVAEPTGLVFFDLANGKTRMGGSALAQVFKEIGSEAPDVDNPSLLKSFLLGCQKIHHEHPDLVLAYHDRSDGGLFTTIIEMCMAGRAGAEIFLHQLQSSAHPLELLFNEELGAVIQVREKDLVTLATAFISVGFPSNLVYSIATVNKSNEQTIKVHHHEQVIFSNTRQALQRTWAETSYKIQSIRDNAATSQQEHDLISDETHSGIIYDLHFTPLPLTVPERRPAVAILREQGVNGHMEMAWSFTAAGFDAIDVHMSDILSGRVSLKSFRGLAACGGFSYGDVLGAGKGWAHSVLLNDTARSEFAGFFRRPETFTLGACNGCQFLSHLKEIIPGAHDWPDFKQNISERFEGRVCTVEVIDGEITRSNVFLRDMVGSKLPIAVAHGEGRATFVSQDHEDSVESQGLFAVRYVDSQGRPTQQYPLNPNGSPRGVTGVQTPDGRVLALMPHPERVVMLESNSWYPQELRDAWKGVGPWFRMFQSVRQWCD